jgi:hypothetical protein
VQWLIIARDGTDAQAPERRMAARSAHLENAARLQASGHLLVGGALTDDDGRMIGSACIAQFATRCDVRDPWCGMSAAPARPPDSGRGVGPPRADRSVRPRRQPPARADGAGLGFAAVH